MVKDDLEIGRHRQEFIHAVESIVIDHRQLEQGKEAIEVGVMTKTEESPYSLSLMTSGKGRLAYRLVCLFLDLLP